MNPFAKYISDMEAQIAAGSTDGFPENGIRCANLILDAISANPEAAELAKKSWWDQAFMVIRASFDFSGNGMDRRFWGAVSKN